MSAFVLYYYMHIVLSKTSILLQTNNTQYGYTIYLKICGVHGVCTSEPCLAKVVSMQNKICAPLSKYFGVPGSILLGTANFSRWCV